MEPFLEGPRRRRLRAPRLVRDNSDRTVRAAASSLPMRQHLQRLKSEAETARERAPALHEELPALLKLEGSHDMVLRSGDEEVPCHRAVLWARVRLLRDAIEKLPTEAAVLEVAGQPPGTLAHSVELIYEGANRNLTGSFAGVAEGPEALVEDMQCLLREGHGVGSCTLVCAGAGDGDDGWSLEAHAAVLLARSEYFRALKVGPFQEAGDESPIAIDPSLGISKELASCILEAVYTDMLPSSSATSADAVDIWAAADYFSFPAAAAMAEQKIAEQVSFETVLDTLTWAEDQGVQYVRRMAYRFLRTNFAAVADNPSVLFNITPATLLSLLDEDALQASDETAVLQAVLAWSTAQPRKLGSQDGVAPSDSNVLPQLLSKVRLALIDAGDGGDFARALPDETLRALFLKVCPAQHRARAAQIRREGRARAQAMEDNDCLALPRLTPENITFLQEEHRSRERQRFDMSEMMVCRMFHPTNGRNNFEHLPILWKGILPEAATVARMLAREKELRLRDENQEAYACPGPSTAVTEWIQLRVCREFGLSDAHVDVLRGAAALYPNHHQMKEIPHYVRFNRSRSGDLRPGMTAPDVPLATATGDRTTLTRHLDPERPTVLIAGSTS